MTTAAPSPTVPADKAGAATRPGGIVSHIRAAADATGVPFAFLLKQARRESGLDPEATSRRSSAAGLFQFTAPTWLEMVRRHGAAHGLGEQAGAIAKGADGRLEVADKAARKAILDLRRDPQLSALMAAEYAKDNAKVLQGKLGRPATAADLTLAHLLGAGGAAKVLAGIAADPEAAAAGLLPQAARANPELFRDGKRPRSLAALYDAVAGKAAGPVDLRPRVDLAMLRPLPRPEDPAPGPAPEPARLAAPTSATVAAAIVPPNPFFPVAMPPPAGTTARADTVTLGALIAAMEEKPGA